MNRLTIKIISILTGISFFFTSTIAPALAVNYTYDANGNKTSDGTTCYHYNEANHMDKVYKCSNNQTIAEYIYDYNGKRIVKKEYENGTLKRTIYSPNDEYETVKLASNGATQNTTYYKVNDEVVAKKNPDGSIYYYQNDHLGSNSVLIDQSGNVVEKTTYEPYGEVKSGGTKSKFGYTGQEKDNETGLNYYDSRYYDSHIQQFIQPDTLLPDVYDPQQLNRYSYARNNPLKYIDPSGNDIVLALMGVGLFAYAAIALPAILPTNHNQTNGAALISSLWSWLNTYSFNKNTTRTETDKKTTQNDSSTKQQNTNTQANKTGKQNNPVDPKTQIQPKNEPPQIKNWDQNRNPAQDKKLSDPEIRRLKKGGIDIHELKEQYKGMDLFKDPKSGEVMMKPSSGKGPGEPLDINIKDY